jgi:hypothetical protein
MFHKKKIPKIKKMSKERFGANAVQKSSVELIPISSPS